MRPLEDMFVGKTFDDFLCKPQFSLLSSRRQVNLTMPLTENIMLNLPLVAANMDTVTEADMAKTMAWEGGIGFIHRNCSVKQQAKMVTEVKRRHAYIIKEPLTIPEHFSVKEARKKMKEIGVSCALVGDGNKLVGLFSHRDIPSDPSLIHNAVNHFMTPLSRLTTSFHDVSLEQAEQIMFNRRVEKLPLVDGLGNICGLITMRDLNLCKEKPFASRDRKGRLLVGATVGVTNDFADRAVALSEAGADVILVDIAHAHSKAMIPAIKLLKTKINLPIICGNIGTRQAAEFLMDLGVDAIKVGIGPGRGCRTRLETGAGVPQLQAIRDVYCGTEGKTPIIADGGVKNDKDIFLAMACGASTVMLGSMLSGTKEAPGMIVEDPATKQKMKLYRGMTSPEAVADGSDSEEIQDALSTPSEGQSITVPYIGSVVDVLQRIRGHLQSSVSYGGTKDLWDACIKIRDNPTEYLIPLSSASQRESFNR